MVVTAVGTPARPAHLAAGPDVLTRQEQDHMAAPEVFEVRLRTHRSMAIVELFGELDLATVSEVAVVFEGLAAARDGFQHIVLDLRGLTFMDAAGIREVVRQSNDARQKEQHLTVVRGSAFISRLMAITGVDALLVLVERLEDLVLPLCEAHGAKLL